MSVTPRARRNEFAGWLGDTLKVRVRAPAEKGRANEAVCALIAEALGVPRSAVIVERGHASREKMLAIEGTTNEQVRHRLAEESQTADAE